MKKSFYSVLILILIFLGFLLRLNQYLAKPSIWLDETALVWNIVNRSYFGLLKPLSLDQSAPVGFLILSKLIINFIGNNEYTLRLISQITGLSSVILFYFLAKRLLSKNSIIIALILFVFSAPLITYSTMFKQYSSDLAIGLILYLVFLNSLDSRITSVKLLILIFLGGISVWFSQTAVIILASLEIYILLVLIKEKKFKDLIKYLIIFAASVISFYVNYFFVLSKSIAIPGLRDYWSDKFAPWPIWSNFGWYRDNFMAVFKFPLGLNFPLIGLGLFILGSIYFFKENKKNLLLLLLPVLLTLFASLLKVYPFSVRLLIFLTPFFYIIIAHGLGKMFSKKNIFISLVGAIFLAWLIIPFILQARSDFINKPVMESVRPAMQYYLNNRQTGDVLYIYYGAIVQYQYYLSYFKAEPAQNTVTGVNRMKGINVYDYAQDLDKLKGKKRVWLLFSHDSVIHGIDEEDFFVNYLNSIGKRLDNYSAPGTSIYLYDLSQ